jgi:uncharacterized protein (DUF2336 family)
VSSALKRFFRRNVLPSRLSYEEGRAVLEGHEQRLEEELAGHCDAEPEMLYYLAERGSTTTRRKVAANPSTPPKANRLLAEDVDVEVRGEVARKIGRLLPELLSSDREAVCQQTLDSLERLAIDQVPFVRAILAEEIKHLDCVPRRVVAKLARDVVEEVSVPILEYSPLLWDDDLIEIVKSARVQSALAAIARRRGLSESVSAAIVESMDVSAITALLSNADARIREQTMESLVDHAEEVLAWHDPLASRADLSLRVLRRVAGFVGAALLERLAERNDLDEETRIQLNRSLRARLEKEDLHTQERQDKASVLVRDAKRQGKLNERFVESAAERGQRELVMEGLAVMADAPRPVVEKIFSSRSAKGITALAWRAGLHMRVAFKIQVLVMKLKSDELLAAREGVAYPLSEDDMRWHLSYFGLTETKPAR